MTKTMPEVTITATRSGVTARIQALDAGNGFYLYRTPAGAWRWCDAQGKLMGGGATFDAARSQMEIHVRNGGFFEVIRFE